MFLTNLKKNKPKFIKENHTVNFMDFTQTVNIHSRFSMYGEEKEL